MLAIILWYSLNMIVKSKTLEDLRQTFVSYVIFLVGADSHLHKFLEDAIFQNVCMGRQLKYSEVDFKKYKEVHFKRPLLGGKWFCRVDLESLTTVDMNWIEAHLRGKRPEGVLVVRCADFRKYRSLYKIRTIRDSINASILELRYPGKGFLLEFARWAFIKSGVSYSDRLLRDFVSAVGQRYADYVDFAGKVGRDGVGFLKDVVWEPVESFIDNVLLEGRTHKHTPKKGKIRPSQLEKLYEYYKSEYGLKGLMGLFRRRLDRIYKLKVLWLSGKIYKGEKVSDEFAEPMGLVQEGYGLRKLFELSMELSLEDIMAMQLSLEQGTELGLLRLLRRKS